MVSQGSQAEDSWLNYNRLYLEEVSKPHFLRYKMTTRQTVRIIDKKHYDKISLAKLFYNKKYVLWNAGNCPIASKVGHVTLATPPFGVIHHTLM